MGNSVILASGFLFCPLLLTTGVWNSPSSFTRTSIYWTPPVQQPRGSLPYPAGNGDMGLAACKPIVCMYSTICIAFLLLLLRRLALFTTFFVP
ncbi:hypothetical protein V8F06_003302 [Rhypophila decipiens]